MSEQNFWGMTFSDFCRANPRESFEALRPRYLKIQEENKLHNEQTRRKYLARLEADKAQKRLESEHRAARAALAREAAVKRQLRYKYANLTEAQYDGMWQDIFKEFLLDEARLADAAFRKNYQF
jgi:ABC-type phosphate transport system auxiliary subunit